MKITMNALFVMLLATFLALAQSGVGDQTIIRQFTDVDVQETNDETPAQWFRRLPHLKRRFINLQFYIHDTLAGANATAYEVAKATITDQSPVGFGTVMVFDAPILDGPDLSTATEIGRGQGMNAIAAFDEATPLLANTFLFNKIYSGSTLSILGRLKQDSVVREFPVVGGTGVFRGAHGTATLTTVTEEPRILDCNLYFEYYL